MWRRSSSLSLLSVEVFIFKAIPVWRSSFLSLLDEQVFIFEAFLRAPGERLLVSELLVL
jgi:hypothetical protein